MVLDDRYLLFVARVCLLSLTCLTVIQSENFIWQLLKRLQIPQKQFKIMNLTFQIMNIMLKIRNIMFQIMNMTFKIWNQSITNYECILILQHDGRIDYLLHVEFLQAMHKTNIKQKNTRCNKKRHKSMTHKSMQQKKAKFNYT